MSDVKITISTNSDELTKALQGVKVNFENVQKAGTKANSAIVAGQNAARKSTDALNNAATNGFKRSTQAAQTFAGVLTAQAFVAGINGLIGAFRGLANGIAGAVAAASEKQEAQARLEGALAATGRTAAGTGQRLSEFAQELDATTRFTEEQVKSSTQLLATTTNLSEQGLKTATVAAADLAAGLKIDLQTATLLVTKTIGGQTGALERYGISVKAGATETENLTNLLKASSAVQGAAARDSQTFAGRLDQLEKAYNSVIDNIGKFIIESEAVKSLVSGLANVFNNLSNTVVASARFFNEYGTTILNVGAFLTTFVGTVGAIALAFRGYQAALVLARTAQIAFNGALLANPLTLIPAAVAAVVAALVTLALNYDKVKLAALEFAATTVSSFLTAAQAVQQFTGINVGVESLSNALTKIQAAAEASRQAVVQSTQTTVEANDQKAKNEEQTADRILKTQQKLAEERQRKEAENAQKLLEVQLSALEASKVAELTAQQQFAEITGQGNEQSLQTTLDLELQKIELQRQFAEARANLIADEGLRAIELEKVRTSTELAEVNARNKLILDRTRQRIAEEQKLKQFQAQQEQQFFNNLVVLSQSGSKELAAVAKAGAIAQIAVKTPESVSNAYTAGTAVGGPPVGVVFAAAALAAQVQLARQAAAAQGPRFQDGGIVPGQSYRGDLVQARVNSGEMILNMDQQKRLFAMANGGGGGGAVINTSVELDGEVIARAVSRQVADGLELGRAV